MEALSRFVLPEHFATVSRQGCNLAQAAMLEHAGQKGRMLFPLVGVIHSPITAQQDTIVKHNRRRMPGRSFGYRG